MATTTPAPVHVDLYQADWRERKANAERFTTDKHTDECFLCGRGLTAKAVENGWAVHLRTDNMLLPVGEPWDSDEQSQGWFPVGSECAKRVPLTHRGRFL